MVITQISMFFFFFFFVCETGGFTRGRVKYTKRIYYEKKNRAYRGGEKKVKMEWLLGATHEIRLFTRLKLSCAPVCVVNIKKKSH